MYNRWRNKFEDLFAFYANHKAHWFEFCQRQRTSYCFW